MPIIAFRDTGHIDHRCTECGLVRTLALDPAKGDLRVNAEKRSLTISSCPDCRARGVHVSEHPNLAVLAHEAGEGPAGAPDSLVGTEFPEFGTIVTEHVVGTHLTPERVAMVALTRQALRHPHLAAHAPLEEDYRARMAAWAATKEAQAQFDALDGMAKP